MDSEQKGKLKLRPFSKSKTPNMLYSETYSEGI